MHLGFVPNEAEQQQQQVPVDAMGDESQRCNVVDGCCMPCALLLLLLSPGHDLAAKKEKNRMRDENKKGFY